MAPVNTNLSAYGVYMKYKLLVYDTCLQRHHPIVNDRNYQKANAISISRIRIHLKSIVLNHKIALFLIPPPPIDTKLLEKKLIRNVCYISSGVVTDVSFRYHTLTFIVMCISSKKNESKIKNSHLVNLDWIPRIHWGPVVPAVPVVPFLTTFYTAFFFRKSV